ncbi:hypothetical protein J5N97_003513 [Dioscorea zingiberensis]|uniref:Uncharacterized protein n=1 Tax=Dioscorea zingiberensis TaxID=325984 RepID=A0A9D5HRC0_9LILI|nr:hypothetical protein J5N97_003513 [Dioscorea zingiberensis]
MKVNMINMVGEVGELSKIFVVLILCSFSTFLANVVRTNLIYDFVDNEILLRICIPDGVINVVTGFGPTAGRLLRRKSLLWLLEGLAATLPGSPIRYELTLDNKEIICILLLHNKRRVIFMDRN